MSEASKQPITSADLYLDEIVVTLRRMEVTLELIEQSLGVVVWQGMPWWRRWANSWHEARETLHETEPEQPVIFRTTDGT
jgi:hypothetical protein